MAKPVAEPVAQPTAWRLKEHVSILLVSEKSVLVSWLGQRINITTTGRAPAGSIPRIFEQLRGSSAIEQLGAAAGEAWPRAELEKFLAALCRRGLAYTSRSSTASRDAAGDSVWHPYFQQFNGSVEQWQETLAKLGRLRLHVHTRMSPPPDFLSSFRAERAAPDFAASPDGDVDNVIHLYLLSANADARLDEQATAATASGAAILPVLLDLHGAVIGPLCGGPGRPCLRCLGARLRTTKTHIDISTPAAPFDDVEHAWPLTYWRKVDAVLTEEIFKLTSQVTYSSLERGAFVFDFLNHRSDYEDVFPVPGCPCTRTSFA